MSPLRRMRTPAFLAVAALVLAAAGTAVVPSPAARGDRDVARAAALPLDPRPNILLISTDDQNPSDLKRMPRTRRLIGGAGATFTDMLSPHPLCCPARAEILTGQYTHNNGVRSNNSRWHGAHPYLKADRTIATWLQAAGYSTAFVGKYLNQYHLNDGREPGWDIWNPTVARETAYYGYTMFNDGDPKRYDGISNVDLVSQKTVAYIDRLAGEDKPFFIWSSQVAPHLVCGGAEGRGRCNGIPPVPSRHKKKFRHARSPSLKMPSFNEQNVKDKPTFLRKKGKVKVGEVNRIHRGRIRSLLAVDEGVAAAIGALKRTGELDNTLVLFVSDNGYLLGQHRYISKDVPYEEALEVPLLMRGPGIPAGVKRKQTVTMVDLAPTFLDAANAVATLTVDGRSILPVATRGRAGNGTVLIQSGPTRDSEIRYGWSYRGVRTSRYTYVRWLKSGFVELYDRSRDPYEMRNVARDRAYKGVRKALAKRYLALRSCAGAGCHVAFPRVPAPKHH